jgi:glycosyltransferase involved in cell wall biosynthesis
LNESGFMAKGEPISFTCPLFSIVIAVYNNWDSLNHCLQSLQQQSNAPAFEVIIIDDGSTDPAPQYIRDWLRCYSLTIERKPHAGTSAAKNSGIQIAKGEVVFFIDSDCKPQTNCLAVLASTIAATPLNDAFQLHLIGDRTSLVGRAEELRLIALQNQMLQPDGRIRYLNTAGFAIRRTKVNAGGNLFHPMIQRGEDTLLLSDLIRSGKLPLFVPQAIVQHVIPLSLTQWMRKTIRSSYFEAATYNLIGPQVSRFRASPRERLSMLSSMWKTSGQQSIGKLAWFVAVVRQSLRLIVLSLAAAGGGWSSSPAPQTFPDRPSGNS